MSHYVPYFYFVSHQSNHHKEENGYHDHSSTLLYDRTSFTDIFGRYAFALASELLAPVKLVRYFWTRRRIRLLALLLIGYCVYSLLLWALCCQTSLAFASFVLYITLWSFGFGNAFHNVFWHNFIDSTQEQNVYRNTVCWIKDDLVLSPFRSGLGIEEDHVEHHLHPSRKAKDAPQVRNLELHRACLPLFHTYD